ncbi:MAG TPA: hypothetical protein VFS42_10100 [Burkholderiaceae bacterium]|nr:hypothetical protein [Burkholderiaceae bacterium]
MSHTAHFIWDDGEGESCCSSLYLETRNLLRVACGKAAEARLQNNHDLAERYELKIRSLTQSLSNLRKTGHLGEARVYSGNAFETAFANARPEHLKIL